jgi:hypothetical protein
VGNFTIVFVFFGNFGDFHVGHFAQMGLFIHGGLVGFEEPDSVMGTFWIFFYEKNVIVKNARYGFIDTILV